MKITKIKLIWLSVWEHSILRAVLYFLLHLGAVELGNFFSSSPDVISTFWPSSGLLIAILLLNHRAKWPSLLLAAAAAQFVADVVLSSQGDIGLSLYFIAVDICVALVATLLLHYFVKKKIDFTTLNEVLLFAVFGVIISPILGATLAAIGIQIQSESTVFWFNWQLWWASDALGIFLAAPFILTWTPRIKLLPKIVTGKRRLIEISAIFLSLIAVVWLVFGQSAGTIQTILNVPFAIFPFLIWVAIRFSPRVITLTNLLVGIYAVFMTNRGFGSFVHSDLSIFQNTISLQIFIAVMTFSTLMLTAVFAERNQTKTALENTAIRLSNLQKIDRAILSEQSRETVLLEGIRYLNRLVPTIATGVTVFDFNKNVAKTVALDDRFSEGIGAELDLGLFGIDTTLKHGHIHTVDVVKSHHLKDPYFKQLNELGVNAYVNVPMRVEEELIGSLNLGFEQLSDCAAEHIDIAQEIASQLAIAVQQSALSAAEQEARYLAETLRSANIALGQSLDLQVILETLLTYLARLVPFDSATVMISVDEEHTLLDVMASRGHEQMRSDNAQTLPVTIKTTPLLIQMIEQSRSLLINDTQNAPDWEHREMSRAIRNWMGIPLIAQGKTLGVYSLTKTEPNFFTSEHLQTAEALAAQAAIAIENAQLYFELQSYAKELELRVEDRSLQLKRQYERQAALAEIELSINQPHELHSVLDRIVHLVNNLLPATGGTSIILWDAKTESYSTSASTFSEQSVIETAKRVRRREGATRWIIDQGKPLIVPDVRDDPFGANPMLAESGLNAYVGLPLLNESRVLGVLYALDKEMRQYKDEDINFLTAVASRASTAIAKVNLYEQTVHRAQELEAIYKVSQDITATLALSDLLPRIAQHFANIIGADRCLIILVDEARTKLTAVAGVGYSKEQLKSQSFEEIEEGIGGWVWREKKPTLIVDLMADPRNVGAARESIQKTRDKSAIIVPLLVGHNIIGSLAVVNGRYSRVFNQEDVNIVTTMANQASLAIRNGQLYKAAQEADRLKSIFLASMSHELRTPLNSIIGFTGIILQELAGPLNKEQMKQMGMVRGSAHHLLDLINDVLDISKIEAGQLQVSQESCNVHEIVAKVLQSLTPDAEKKGLALTAVLTPHSTEISSDKRRVEQILINLVNNGIKFTDRGTVQVQTKVQDDWLLVKVIDTGIGIKEKDIEKLFNPFQQIETGLNRVHEGTGLGLSICQRLVHLLGGEISVVSEWGMGSTFSFILPL